MVHDYQENYGSGWVSIYRSIRNHWIFENDKYFKWWVIILFEVNHQDRKFTRYYDIYDIKRGQSCNSLRRWSELFKTTPKTVSRFFDLLEKDKMIYTEKIGKGKQALTLITVNNYNDYQGKSKQDLPQEVNKKETRSKQGLPTNNNVNNYNNENNKGEIKKIDVDSFDIFKIEIQSEGETEWINNIYRSFKFRDKALSKVMDVFIVHLRCDPETKPKTLTDFKKHFYYWLLKVNSLGKLTDYQKK